MRHRIIWPVVAVLALGGLFLIIRQSTAQRPEREAPPGGMPGRPFGMPGRFVVANAHLDQGRWQVLILDTATGQVYRAKDEDFKKMSELPHMGQPGARDAQPPTRDRRPQVKDREEKRPTDDRRPEAKDKDRPSKRDDRTPPKDKDEVRPTTKDLPPSRREEKE